MNRVHGPRRIDGEERDKPKYKAKRRNSAFQAKVKNGPGRTARIPRQQGAGTIQSSQAPVQEGTGYPDYQITILLIANRTTFRTYSYWLLLKGITQLISYHP